MKKRRLLTTASLAAVAGTIGFAQNTSAQCTGFSTSTSTGATIVPGTTDIGNHGDDVVTTIPLPFPVVLYGVTYNNAAISSNGVIQFNTTANAWSNQCLPNSSQGVGIALFPHWDDLRTDGTGRGIFTSVSGVAPNRVFNIEWRVAYLNSGQPLNFQARLFEDGSKVEYIYANVPELGASATIGAQHPTFPSTQYACNSGGLSNGLKLTLTCSNGPVPPQGTGSASPGSVYACGAGSSTLLSIQASSGFNPSSTGLAVVANLSGIGGSSSQMFYDDGTHGDATAGDNRFSYQASVGASVTPGTKNITFTVSDEQERSASGAFSLIVNACPTAGPDVFVGDLSDMSAYGTVDVDPGAGVLNVSAYSVGTNACNMGDVPVTWIDDSFTPPHASNEHPVIAQNMYRLKGGRFEQIGQSWLKHGFTSTNSGFCFTNCVSPPLGGQQLGVNCSDLYGSGLNGAQGSLGPRSQVNPTTGIYPHPYSAPAAPATIGRRLQVFTNDVTPALNVGARYFVDGHYVTQDDAQYSNGSAPGTNGLNNHTYREVTPASLVSGTPTFAGNSVRFKAGIQAWKDVDPTVVLGNADYVDTSLGTPGIVARFIVASKVTDNGNGTWHYEYAVYNNNADRCAGRFAVPIDPSATVTNIGFTGVFSHSGEPYPNTALNLAPWSGVKSGSEVVWACDPYNAGDGGNSSNAIRWGTMYNFRFDCNVPPAASPVEVGLFKPPTAASPLTSVSATVVAPIPVCGSSDFNGDGDFGTDADIEAFFACLAGNCCDTCFAGGADFNMDGDTGTDADIEAFFRVLAGGNC